MNHGQQLTFLNIRMNQWIDWVKQIRAISQIGKAYSNDVYDLPTHISGVEVNKLYFNSLCVWRDISKSLALPLMTQIMHFLTSEPP